MMRLPQPIVRLTSLVIAAAGTNSSGLPAAELALCDVLWIQSPSAITAATFTVQGLTVLGGTWGALISGAVVQLTDVDQIAVLRDPGGFGLRVQADIVQAAERTFTVSGRIRQ